MTDLQKLGGMTVLTTIMNDFLSRVFDDFIIGFRFVGVDQERIRMMETSFAAAHLGSKEPYKGISLPEAHKRHRINRGQFQRRLALLRTTLRDHKVDEELIHGWISRERKLESMITDGSDCVPSL